MLSWAMLVAEPSQTEGSCLAGLWQCRQLAALGPGPLPSSSILPPENACGGPRARPSRPVPGQVEMCLFFSQFGCHAWSETTSECVCVRVRETTERESIVLSLAHQLLAGRAAMHALAHRQAQRRGASACRPWPAAASSFLAFQEKGLRDVLQKLSKRKFPRSSRASPSLHLCLAAAAPKKVSVLSVSGLV
jgi:hypothetical protein